MNVLSSSLSNEEVLVIFRVCVIAEVQPVEITPEAIFSCRRARSKSKMNLVNPKLGTMRSDAPKFNSITGFRPVFTYELEMIVLFLSIYDLRIDIYLLSYKYQLSRIFLFSILFTAFCISVLMD